MRLVVTCCWLLTLMGSEVAAAELPELADIPGAEAGLVVMVNPADHQDAVRIAGGGRHVVCVLSADAERVRELDQTFVKAELHPVADARRWWDQSRLPFRDHSVNVLVVDASRAPDLDAKEISRVIAPGHGLGLIRQGESWKQVRKPRPEGMDVWLGWHRGSRGHMGSDDALAGPVNSYQFLGGPRTARFTPIVTEQVALWGGIARDPFSGVILRTTNQHTDLWRGGDFSDGQRLYRLRQVSQSGEIPVEDLLTGRTVDGGLVLGADFKRNGGHQYSASRWNQIGSCGQRIYWTNGGRHLRVADAGTRKLIWEKPFEHAAEQCASDGQVVVVMLTENLDYSIDGIYDHVKFNRAVAVVGLDADSGRELWRNTDVAGMPSNFLSIGHGVVVASTYIVAPKNREKAKRPVSQQGAGYDQYAANRMVAIDPATGRSLWVRGDFPDIDDYSGRQAIAIQPGMVILVGEYHVNIFDIANGTTMRTIKVATPGKTSGDGYEGQYHAVTRQYYFKGNAVAALDGRTPPDLRGNLLHSQRYDTRSTPANGMLYTEPMLGTLDAHNALSVSAALIRREAPRPVADERRLLQRGSAQEIDSPKIGDWPTFRGNNERSAWATAGGPEAPKLAWEARVGVATGPRTARTIQQGWRFNPQVPGPITQPVADARRVLVASPDAHRLDCLALTDGKPIWSMRLGGRISGPPTLAGEVAFVGCNDGTVSAVNLADGSVIWTFLAAANHELILAHDQIESLAPVPQPTLFNGSLYVTAGRHAALEDGIYLWVLDPTNGAVRNKAVLGSDTPSRVNDILQAWEGSLQLFSTRIDPRTLAVTRAPQIKYGNTETEAPHAIPDGGGIGGGSTWIRPTDQWMGYNNDSNPGVLVRADGLRVDVHGWNDRYITVRERDTERIINLPNHPFDLLQAVGGAGGRLYLAGQKDGRIRLVVVEVASGAHRAVDLPGIRPSELGIIPDGRHVIRHGKTRAEPDRENVIPDGIAIAHGHVIVTTTAGRVLAFK
jgi:outer membrane protein assembly factor BamB